VQEGLGGDRRNWQGVIAEDHGGVVEINQVYVGDVTMWLSLMEDESVDCIVTSPPYYGLRDYQVEGQIGLEPTLGGYLDKMLAVTAELKRVLKKTGVMYLNHGDSYGGSNGVGYKETKWNSLFLENESVKKKMGIQESVPAKSLMLQNYRLALRMIDEQQWILRNQLIWWKPNCMPSSAKDRYTVDFEPVFFFSKSKKYFFDVQHEPVVDQERLTHRLLNPENFNRKQQYDGKSKTGQGINPKTAEKTRLKILQQGRNPRCVWRIPTQPYPESHFAVFPEKLIEPMIRAGCPVGGLVLDPFMGSGTVAQVATCLNRNWLGIELNPEYEKLIRKRLDNGK
jgi:site-specific DNA-methyltransferase (adenine-specific)